MNDVEGLIATGQALLCLAQSLDAEGMASEARELYRRAFQQGIVTWRNKLPGFWRDLWQCWRNIWRTLPLLSD